MSLPDVGVDDIPKHYSGDLEDFTPDFLAGKLGEAVDMIHSRYGNIVERRLESGELTTRLYTGIVVRIASRVFANPEGFRKENEGGYGYEINAAVGSGTLWFTDDDILDLTGTHPKADKRPGFKIGTASIGLHRPGGRW